MQKSNLFFITMIILTTVFFTGCLTDEQNDSEEKQPKFSYPFRLAQFTADTYLRFSFSEDTAIENFSLAVKPEGIVFYENWGPIIAEMPASEEFKVSTSGTHLWEFYGRKNGTVELDFKLADLSDNSIKERFIYQVDVDENNRSMKLTSARQLKMPANSLEKEVKIKENKIADITFQEYSDPNKRWILEVTDYGGKLKMVTEEITPQTDEINIHQWNFKGDKQGSVRLTYREAEPPLSGQIRKNEIHYDFYVNEDMTIDLTNAEYWISMKVE